MHHRWPDICRALVAVGPAILLAWALSTRHETVAAEPAPPERSNTSATDSDLVALLAAFDSDHFATRQRARVQLSRLLGQQHDAAPAILLHRALLDPATSIELRGQLQRLYQRFPDLEVPAPPADLTVEEITATVAQLNADTAPVRLAAAARLDWYAKEAKLACRMLAPLKAAMANPATTRDSQPVLKFLVEQARQRWLPDDTLDALLPTVSETQIRAWIARVAEPTAESVDERFRQDVARSELLDLLAREAYRDTTAELIGKAKDTAADPEGAFRLSELFDWTPPGMVAECWLGGRHVTIQYLLIGVPQVPEGARNATQFDRIDDHTAHCVSGNSLQPGDYPVGVAIPDPAGREMVFRLINQRTPRQRMLYEKNSELPQEQRYAEISRQTVKAILADKRHLSETEVSMLTHLDPAVVSGFAGDYFAAVPDRALQGTNFTLNGQATEHDVICFVLARIGTRAAQPALEREALARATTEKSAMPAARLASLAIARRDPWPGVDDWLAELIAKEVKFATPRGQMAELGATAAALLAWRHGVPDAWFDLNALQDDTVLESVGITPYRFKQPEGRAKILRWWQRQRSEETAVPAS